MGSNVFANGREISAKADGNKSIAAMADVCLSPPSPPAGPLPLPYPNFSEASDTADGSKTVKIGGQEVGQKDKSNYKKSKGNEAATRSFGMGVVTHTIQGKTQHSAWSFDVLIEGENAIRHMDLTTHNHGSNPFNMALTTDVGKVQLIGPNSKECKELEKKNEEKREELGHDDKTSTITHANYKPPGGKPQSLWSCSTDLAGKYASQSGYCKGLGFKYSHRARQKKDRRKKRDVYYAKPTNIDCPAAKKRGFKYRPGHTGAHQNPHTSHTEPRIIENVMGSSGFKAGGTLTMAINWKSESGGTQHHPCPDCVRVICAAAACGLNIKICVASEALEKKKCPDKLDGS
ncbi:DUF4150 domain-containing protein [Pseudorhodoferax sp. Leaf267]|uniref:DUF4150 domain-containing protein n=1 Tax=Pseudorhodoferax sp. Leaf267 TaxID=1736316 RepID=UPI0006F57512|nr:DUF4150 domain-containing protein [Pseudorhodoferax sp. Leaf267]KQP22422.1 hypothetical protein ASF43_00365 [Pseudorhodoferax sp. Leaf267]